MTAVMDLDTPTSTTPRPSRAPWAVAAGALAVAALAILAPRPAPEPAPAVTVLDAGRMVAWCHEREASFVAEARQISAAAGHPVTARDETIAAVGYQTLDALADGRDAWPVLTPADPPATTRADDPVAPRIIESAQRWLCPLSTAAP